MKHIALIVGVSLTGCTAWLDKLHGDSPPPKPAVSKLAHVEFIPDSFQFVHDWTKDDPDVLWFTYNSVHVWDNHPEELHVVLDGPGVHEDMKADSDAEYDEWIGWAKTWPDGHYKVTLTHFGTPLGSQELDVKRSPRLRGGGDPVVPTHGPAPMIMVGREWHTMFGINVTKPIVSVNAVWMKDGAPLEKGTDVVERADQLWEQAALGVYRKAAGKVSPSVDLHDATLFVFLDSGERYVGAWTYEDSGDRAIALPPAHPDAAQLRAAQEAAREAGAESERWVPDLHASADEAVACAAASSPEVRDAVTGLHDAHVEIGMQVHRQLEAQDQLDDPDLTPRQRARLKEKQRTAGYYTEAAGTLQEREQAALAKAMRKQKKGCLVALGVPAAPGPTPLGDGPVASRRKK